MEKILLVFTAVTMMCFTCKKERLKQLPDCLKSRIEQIRAQHTWNPPAEIHEYRYKGQTVYLVTADCCDQYITVSDNECNYICAPAGGYTGKGDEKCKDFYDSAKHVRLIWKDER